MSLKDEERQTLISLYLKKSDEAFEDATDIDINGEELYSTMFLVESETFNNKILKLCHI